MYGTYEKLALIKKNLCGLDALKSSYGLWGWDHPFKSQFLSVSVKIDYKI